MDFSGVYFVEELHHDKGVEDDGVVLRRRGVEGCVAATVNVKDLFTYRGKEQRFILAPDCGSGSHQGGAGAAPTDKEQREDDDELIGAVS